MNIYNFILTDDNSVGLYNNIVNDIYHSKTGAYKEALDKFVNPILSLPGYQSKKEINILDICYGIGYNSKSLLNNINNDVTIHIDSLEYDKNLVALSALVKDNINDINLKLFILSQLIKNKINLIDLEEHILTTNNEFLTDNICDFIKFLIFEGYKYNPQEYNYSFLHNIYYNYISDSMNNNPKYSKYMNSSIRYHFDDARNSIKSINNTYNIVFLDAFSSQKDPTLWTINFLSQVKQKMNNDSILVSYSKSTPFRSALLELGFNVGKTYIDNIDMGTIASMNNSNIINPLNDFDLELLSTRSGITYKDPELNLSGREILINRENEQKSSSKISHTAFLKKYKK